ncbi:MAG: phosphate acyltransferase PlsX [Candidatus Neomarinimicrobiota bacterium]
MRIAVDAMGGDFAPEATVQGSIDACKLLPGSLEIILLGNSKEIETCLTNPFPKNITIFHTEEIVTMSDKGSKALKSKPNSSLVKGIKMVKDRQADAFISAGNTGAIMATSLFLLGRAKNVKRPALGAFIPTGNGGKILCDVGANPNVKPLHMLQFSVMASIYLEHVEGITNPKIGLVNIGTEPGKGTDLYIQTYKLLSDKLPNFIGNIEGRHIFDTDADVIICDGFVGNILLKFAEGWSTIYGNMLKEKIISKLTPEVDLELLEEAMNDIHSQYDYEEHGGSPLLGINGVAVVAHGSSGSKAIKNSILVAEKCVRENLVHDIASGMSQYMETSA